MVRETKYRSTKWDKKIDPLIVFQRFSTLKDVAKEQLDPYLTQVVATEKKVKEFLEKQGVKTIQIAMYLAYARELLGKTFSTFSSETLRNEELAIRQKWVTRGLEDVYLKEIARMFGIDPKPLPVGIVEFEYVDIIKQTVLHEMSEYFDQHVTQTFIVDKPCFIRELLLSLDWRRPITITFYEGYKETQIFQKIISSIDEFFVETIEGVDFYGIHTPFVKLVPNKLYSFDIYSPDVYLGHSGDPNSYPDGKMYVDGEEFPADLTFVLRGIKLG